MRYLLSLALIVASPAAVFADDSLASARELYASAAYEDALAMLGRLNSAAAKADEGRVADQYRALCLLALGKTSEASQAIEAVVSADPGYRPADGDVSPRVRAVFSDVRKRLLPGLVQQKYAHAKSAYERKDYKTATVSFGQLLALFDDPDLALAAGRPPLSDLRQLADGFNQLSLQALAPPPVPEPAVVAAAKPVAPQVPEPPKVYTSSDSDVVPPVIVRQELPPFSGSIQRAFVGAMEVLIDENGRVVSASMRGAGLAGYERTAIAAAQSWRYRPATLNGAPVKFRKFIQVSLTPQ
jgi:tetratricopeptide (TPR) repeat protein